MKEAPNLEAKYAQVAAMIGMRPSYTLCEKCTMTIGDLVLDAAVNNQKQELVIIGQAILHAQEHLEKDGLIENVQKIIGEKQS